MTRTTLHLPSVLLAGLPATQQGETINLGGPYTAAEHNQFRRRVHAWNKSEVRAGAGLPTYAVSYRPAGGTIMLTNGPPLRGAPHSNTQWLRQAAALPLYAALAVRWPDHAPNLHAIRMAVGNYNSRPKNRACPMRTLVLPDMPNTVAVGSRRLRKADFREGLVELRTYIPVPADPAER